MKAPVGKRIIAYVIDSVVAILIGLVVSVIGSVLLFFVKNAIVNLVGIIILLIGLVLYIAYLLLRDGMSEGRSVGKKMMKLRVVKGDGSPCKYKSSILRNITFLIPIVSFIELILPLVDKEGLRIGDKIAKTQVVE